MATGKRIDKNTIVQEDPLKILRDSAAATDKSIQALSNSVESLTSNLKEIKTAASTLKGGLLNPDSLSTKGISDQISKAREANQLMKEQQITVKLLAQAEQARQAELIKSTKQQTQLNNAIDQANKVSERTAARRAKEISEYSRVDRILGKLIVTYRDLAVKQALGQKLTEAQTQKLEIYNQRLQRADTILKTVDKSYGRSTRFVGEYERANYGLSNSINQLTRELPAFAINMNTGFLAISNNLPIFFDEIKKLSEANRQLAEDGKKPISVFKQLGSSLFSFQTLLSVGVTLLTVYGGKIVDFFDELFTGREKVDALKVAQEGYTDTLDEFRSGVVDAAAKVKLVGANFELARRGVISKKEALKVYNEELGDSLGKATSLNQAEAIYRDKSAAFIKATALRAQATALFQKAAEEKAKALTAEFEDQVSMVDKTVSGLQILSGNVTDAFENVAKSQKEGVKEAQENAKKREFIFEREATLILQQSEELENMFKIDLDGTDKSIKAHKANKISLEEYNAELLDLIELQRKLSSKNSEFAAGQLERLVGFQFENAINQIQIFKSQRDEAIKAIEDSAKTQDQKNKEISKIQSEYLANASKEANMAFKEITANLDEEYKIREQLTKDNAEEEIRILLNKYDEEYNAQLDAFSKERDQLIENVNQSKVSEIQKAKDRSAIQKSYNDRVKELNDEQVKIEKKKALEIEYINLTMQQSLIGLTQEQSDRLKQIEADLTKFEKDQLDQRNKAEDDELKKAKERAAQRAQVIDALTKFFLERNQMRIDALNREIDAHQKSADYLAQLAANGTITAKQSLAKENEEKAKALLEEQRIQRRRAAIELLSTSIKLLDANLANSKNPGTAVGKTIADVTALTAFLGQLSKLNSFDKGTDRLNVDGSGIDGKGGVPIIAHKDEMIIPAKDNAEMGFRPRSEVVNIVKHFDQQQLNKDLLVIKQDRAGNSFDISPLLQKQDELIKAVKNQPQLAAGIEEVTSEMHRLVFKRTENGVTHTGRYIIRK